MVLLLTRFSRIAFYKMLSGVFALKHATELSKHLSVELLKSYEKIKSLTESLKFNQVFKKLFRNIKKFDRAFAL